MGIQINGNTDIISATDGSLTIQGASGNLTGNLTGTATTAQGLTGTPNITVGTIGATSLNASGVVTATSFSGSGANLTGIGGTTDVRTNSLVVSGVSTVTTLNATSIVGTTSINSGQLGGSRNVIINGSMVVNQRGFTGSSGATTHNAYTTDRFYISHSMDGAVSAGQTTMNSTVGGNAYADGFNSALHYRVTTADASLSANQYALLSQPIEGFNVQGFKKGTANAQQFTLSFWVRSSLTGTYIAELYDNDNTRQVSKSYTIDTANTWEKKTLTFPADTTGVFDNDNGASLYVTWFLAAGSTYGGGTLNTSWASDTSANRAVGQVNFLATAGNNFFLTGVQLEVGPTATEFERRSFGQELALCQRYFQKSYDVGTAPGTNTANGRTFVVGRCTGTYVDYANSIFFPVPMRAQPTMKFYTQTGTADSWFNTSSTNPNPQYNNRSESQFSLYVTDATTAGQAGYMYGHWTSSAEL